MDSVAWETFTDWQTGWALLHSQAILLYHIISNITQLCLQKKLMQKEAFVALAHPPMTPDWRVATSSFLPLWNKEGTSPLLHERTINDGGKHCNSFFRGKPVHTFQAIRSRRGPSLYVKKSNQSPWHWFEGSSHVGSVDTTVTLYSPNCNSGIIGEEPTLQAISTDRQLASFQWTMASLNNPNSRQECRKQCFFLSL